MTRVYLARGSEALRGDERFRISADDAARLIASGEARVLEVRADSAPLDVTGR